MKKEGCIRGRISQRWRKGLMLSLFLEAMVGLAGLSGLLLISGCGGSKSSVSFGPTGGPTGMLVIEVEFAENRLLPDQTESVTVAAMGRGQSQAVSGTATRQNPRIQLKLPAGEKLVTAFAKGQRQAQVPSPLALGAVRAHVIADQTTHVVLEMGPPLIPDQVIVRPVEVGGTSAQSLSFSDEKWFIKSTVADGIVLLGGQFQLQGLEGREVAFRPPLQMRNGLKEGEAVMASVTVADRTSGENLGTADLRGVIAAVFGAASPAGNFPKVVVLNLSVSFRRQLPTSIERTFYLGRGIGPVLVLKTSPIGASPTERQAGTSLPIRVLVAGQVAGITPFDMNNPINQPEQGFDGRISAYLPLNVNDRYSFVENQTLEEPPPPPP